MKSFSDRLRTARTATGLTQEQLGFAIGVTKSSISAWENGRETPSFHLLPKLRAALGCSLDALVCGTVAAPASTGIAEPRLGGEASHGARDVKEHALLLRYRALPSRRRAALLELLLELGPEPPAPPRRRTRAKD